MHIRSHSSPGESLFRRAALAAACALAAPALGQTSFLGLGFLPSTDRTQPYSLSSDGSTVVGESDLSSDGSQRAFRWTRVRGIEDLGAIVGEELPYASAVSANGSVIAGGRRGAVAIEAFRWSVADGLIIIDDSPAVADPAMRPAAMTADGSVIVGTTSFRGYYTGRRWTAAAGLESYIPRDGFPSSEIYDITPDGAFAVGTCAPEPFSGYHPSPTIWSDLSTSSAFLVPVGYTDASARSVTPDGSAAAGVIYTVDYIARACLWNAEGATDLGTFDGDFSSYAFAISDDGKTVVGHSVGPGANSRAFVWTKETGLRDLRQILIDSGIDLSRWKLRQVWGISADGTTVAGAGTNPAGFDAGWIAQLSGACRADCNGDGKLNVNDFICFQAAWRARAAYGDFDFSGSFTINDFIAFQSSFVKGCK